MKSFYIFILLFSFNQATPAAQAAVCAFGNDLNILLKNKRFVQKASFETFKLSREKDPVNALLWVYVTPLTDTKTKRQYHLNTTGDDAYDGGNTIGWIEDVTDPEYGVDGDNPSRLTGTGAVVAEISDGSIRCLVDVK